MTTWGMVIDLERCTGCSACVIDCKQRNATPPGVFWKRMETTEIGAYPNTRRMFLPVQCMHCGDPPCSEACPTGATSKRDDGIVEVDSTVCIGCKACMLACPYDARTYVDSIAGYYDELTPFEADGYDAFEPGTVTKCDFCADRLEAGRAAGLTPGADRAATPSCANTCPAGAIHFGDLDDQDDGIQQHVASPRAMQLNKDQGTDPNVYYLMPE